MRSVASRLKARGGQAKPPRRFYEDGSPLTPSPLDDASANPAALPPNGRTVPYYADPRKADADRAKGHFA